MPTVQHKGIDWEEVWQRIDADLTSMAIQMSNRIDNLYVEKGNFKTRDCPINAYLVFANPLHGDVVQMESADMVSLDISFCNKGAETCVTATLSKDIVVSSFHQSLGPMQYQNAETAQELLNSLMKINVFVNQSYEEAYKLLI